MLTTSQYLIDATVRALKILNSSELNEPFDDETVSFFQSLYLWRRPEKFFLNNKEAKIISGTVSLYRSKYGRQRALKFTFSNGYIWMASIRKLVGKKAYKYCRELATQNSDGVSSRVDPVTEHKSQHEGIFKPEVLS